MKKMIGIALVMFLLIASVSSVFAAATVSSAMYGDDTAPGMNMPANLIAQELKSSGITDVKPESWAAGSISLMVKEGFMQADTKGTFKPAAPVTATTCITTLAKVLGISSRTDTPDISVKKAKEAGLIAGSGTNMPAKITRLDFARLVAKAMNVKPITVKAADLKKIIKDSDKLGENDKAVLAALYKLGIFKGFQDKTFRPGEVITNDQLAVLMDRLLGGQAKS